MIGLYSDILKPDELDNLPEASDNAGMTDKEVQANTNEVKALAPSTPEPKAPERDESLVALPPLRNQICLLRSIHRFCRQKFHNNLFSNALLNDPKLAGQDPQCSEQNQRNLLTMLVFTKFNMVEQPTHYAAPTSRELAVSVPRVVSAAYNNAVERLLAELGFSESAIAQANVRIGNKFEIDGFMKFVPIEVAEILISPPQLPEAEVIDAADVAILEASESAGRMLVKLLQLIRVAMCLDRHYGTAYTSRWEKMVGAQVRMKGQARRQQRAVTFAVLSLSFIGHNFKKQLTQLRKVLEDSFLSPWFADMGKDLMIINAGHQVVYPFFIGEHMENIFLTAADSFHGLIAAFIKDKHSRQREIEGLREEDSLLRARVTALDKKET
eukprot:Blabericola_migrator_1__6110@NODE_3085_length_2051_cov_6_946573_g1931_i0_p1_GENE_NODE_3085_length_2051_cov_6_946573_g1931_i0NODE_3085_length_2051_cov_6_946573_g1931_i0_p1_ORF_typecomplete_len383_score71_46Mto2_bdg/PF12808_7/0_26_NODE_3085_length_2051_cov_6_946573_g1931_i02421390